MPLPILDALSGSGWTERVWVDRTCLDGLNGQESKVVDEADFFFDEGLTVAHAGEEAIMARLSKSAFANLLFGNEEARAGRLVRVLRAVGHEGLVALLDERCDVDDEAGTHIRIEAGVDDLEGTVRICTCFDFLQAGEKAGLVAERRGDGVVGVARLPVRKDDDARAELTQNARDRDAILKSVGE